MTLGEFLNHIKHKSLKIEIITTIHYDNQSSEVNFKGTLSEYQTSVVKSEINDKLIEIIIPGMKNDEYNLGIFIKENKQNAK